MRTIIAIIAAAITIIGIFMATQLPQPITYPNVECNMVQTTIAGNEVWVQKCTTAWISTVRGNAFVGAMGIFFLILGGAILLLLIGKGLRE